MVFKKAENTQVRFERYGGFVYILDKTNQNKTKITDENEAFLFWLAINGRDCSCDGKIREWIERGYLEVVDKQCDLDSRFLASPAGGRGNDKISRGGKDRALFEKEFDNKPVDYALSPLLTTLGITASCNFKCRHCGNNSGRRGRKELSVKEIFKLLKELGDLQILKLTITGGEPLLKERFFEILRFAAERIPRVTVTSNGSLIDKKTSQRLKKEGVSALKISLDGAEDFHDKNRGHQGAYQKAVQAIQCLIAEGIEVRVQSTLMRENSGSILELMPILSELGVRVHSIVPVSPIGRASTDLMLNPSEYKDYILKINQKAKEIDSKTVFEIRPVFGLNFKNDLEVLSTKYKCEALKTTLEITPTGNVVPCSFFPVSIGDVRRNSLQDIWTSDQARQLRRVFDERLLEGKCRGCQIKKECGGGCLANSYAVHKKYHLGDVYCWR